MELLISSPDRKIVRTRAVVAGRETVFRAWTDPDHLKNWWGPKGFSCAFSESDLRPGGKWSFVLRGPEQGHYPNECVFLKIVKPELVAWSHTSQPRFQVVAQFDELSNGRTEITFKMLFETPEECRKIKAFAVDNNEQNLDRLEAELEKLT